MDQHHRHRDEGVAVVEGRTDSGASLVLPNIPSSLGHCYQRIHDLPDAKWTHQSMDSKRANALVPRPNFRTFGDEIHGGEKKEVKDASNSPSAGASHAVLLEEVVVDMDTVHPSSPNCCSSIPSSGLRSAFDRKNQEAVVVEGGHPHWCDDRVEPYPSFPSCYFSRRARMGRDQLAQEEVGPEDSSPLLALPCYPRP